MGSQQTPSREQAVSDVPSATLRVGLGTAAVIAQVSVPGGKQRPAVKKTKYEQSVANPVNAPPCTQQQDRQFVAASDTPTANTTAAADDSSITPAILDGAINCLVESPSDTSSGGHSLKLQSSSFGADPQGPTCASAIASVSLTGIEADRTLHPGADTLRQSDAHVRDERVVLQESTGVEIRASLLNPCALSETSNAVVPLPTSPVPRKSVLLDVTNGTSTNLTGSKVADLDTGFDYLQTGNGVDCHERIGTSTSDESKPPMMGQSFLVTPVTPHQLAPTPADDPKVLDELLYAMELPEHESTQTKHLRMQHPALASAWGPKDAEAFGCPQKVLAATGSLIGEAERELLDELLREDDCNDLSCSQISVGDDIMYAVEY